MTTNNSGTFQLEEPLSALERQLIITYLQTLGQDYHALLARDDAEARSILARATLHASEKLTEIESRCHYLDDLHTAGDS
jgi:hypothetical protein